MLMKRTAGSRPKGRSLPARSAAVDAVVIERMKTHRLTRGGLTAMEATTGALTADQLAQVCGVTPRLIDGWTRAGWLPFQTEDDGTILYGTSTIALIEAMLEIAELVEDDATLRRNVLHLRDQMNGLWSRALFAAYFNEVLPGAQSEMHTVTLNKLEGRKVELTFMQRALARLGALTTLDDHVRTTVERHQAESRGAVAAVFRLVNAKRKKRK